jgi:hypothetical protein
MACAPTYHLSSATCSRDQGPVAISLSGIQDTAKQDPHTDSLWRTALPTLRMSWCSRSILMRSRVPRAPSTQSSSGGDLLEPGYSSNYGERKRANFIYLTATLDAPTWGTELAVGEAPGRIYRVEPTGPIEHDPNLTDKKFPGNPTRSYRTRQPLRVVSEVLDWEGHPPDVLQAMLDHLEELKQLGIEAIND